MFLLLIVDYSVFKSNIIINGIFKHETVFNYSIVFKLTDVLLIRVLVNIFAKPIKLISFEITNIVLSFTKPNYANTLFESVAELSTIE